MHFEVVWCRFHLQNLFEKLVVVHVVQTIVGIRIDFTLVEPFSLRLSFLVITPIIPTPMIWLVTTFCIVPKIIVLLSSVPASVLVASLFSVALVSSILVSTLVFTSWPTLIAVISFFIPLLPTVWLLLCGCWFFVCLSFVIALSSLLFCLFGSRRLSKFDVVV